MKDLVFWFTVLCVVLFFCHLPEQRDVIWNQIQITFSLLFHF